jgi:hypothetical protein
LDTKVGVGDIAQFILTVVVAFLIPVSLSPLITNKRFIKDFLIGEAKDSIAFLAQIKDMIDTCAIQGNTSQSDKLKINSKISRDLSIKISSLTTQLTLSFKNKSGELIKEIEQVYSDYWHETTGGELMSENFKFDIRFCTAHDKNYSKLEACLKKSVYQINNY